MDNGVLFFIVVLEAIAIAWLLSKLAHYQKFEHLLKSQADLSATAAAVPRTASVGPTHSRSAEGRETPAQAVEASAAALKASNFEADDDLLDMPGVEPEVNIEEAKRVQLVMARCHYAEFYLEQLDDDYERGQFKHIVNSCMNTARGITDPFFKASALHPLIILLDRAGWESERDRMMAEVDDELIRQRITNELSATAET